MKSLLILFALLLASPAFAQWRTDTYSLKGGWNSIYLHGDASHDSIENIITNQDVVEIWRWVSNPDQVMFTSSPSQPTPGTPEWKVWKRGFPSFSDLTALVGQSAYLVKCNGAASATYSIAIKNKPMPPVASWVRNGANLLGFPSRLNGSTYPIFNTYFATFPSATATNVRIYKYVGGDFSATNPLQIFTPSSERVDRNQAYWFDSEVVGNFYAPLEIELTNTSGLAFGTTGSSITLRIRNRTSSTNTVTIAPTSSDTAPSGQAPITAAVPLTLRSFNSSTNQYEFTPVSAALTRSIAAKGTTELTFGVNRGSSTMTAHAANPSALFASLLRITDSANLLDSYLPVTARNASLAGLWIGDASVTHVMSTISGSGTTTGQPYTLRFLLHVSGTGEARLLSQVFMGKLAAVPYDLGLCTKESGLKADEKATARRISCAHFPLDVAIGPSGSGNSGSVALGSVLQRRVSIPFNDPVNPFLHQYHPDHDNKNARFQPLPAGVESWDLIRDLSFNFSASPLPGETSTAWGASIIGGTYTETLTGAHKQPLTVTGTFKLQRASEISALSIIP